jgi:FKBP-type peptidyl-prolyl cis-trans isomerase SlpA
MEVSNNCKVTFHYIIKIDDDMEIENSYGNEPATFQMGNNELLPAMEDEIKGLQAGDKKEFTLTPDQAFGEYHDDAIMQIPKSNLELRKDIVPGMYIDIQNNQNEVFRGKILDIDDENVTLDFNHPLAGKTLSYQIEIVEVLPV